MWDEANKAYIIASGKTYMNLGPRANNPLKRKRYIVKPHNTLTFESPPYLTQAKVRFKKHRSKLVVNWEFGNRLSVYYKFPSCHGDNHKFNAFIKWLDLTQED